MAKVRLHSTSDASSRPALLLLRNTGGIFSRLALLATVGARSDPTRPALPCRSASADRPVRLGATPDFHHGLLTDMTTEFYLLAVLGALLLGLAVGKAWERYKLRDGRWIDRRRLRETPHYMLGLNFLVDSQVDQAVEELTHGREHRTRGARDPDDSGQPVPRKRAGGPLGSCPPGAPEATRPHRTGARVRVALPGP